MEEQNSVADDVLCALAQLLEAQRDYRAEIVDDIADAHFGTTDLVAEGQKLGAKWPDRHESLKKPADR